MKQITGSDIAFGMDGQILAATLPPDVARGARRSLYARPACRTVQIGERGVRGAAAAARTSATAPPTGAGPVALILRSRTEQLRFLDAIHTGWRSRPSSPVMLATLLSFAVARTITRPLATITGVMRDVAATGDLTRKIVLRRGARWDDEDARLLATTFNTLTDSIARFQREIVAAGAALVARTALDGHRARSAQPADDHQGGAAHAAPAVGAGATRCARRPPTSTARSRA